MYCSAGQSCIDYIYHSVLHIAISPGMEETEAVTKVPCEGQAEEGEEVHQEAQVAEGEVHSVAEGAGEEGPLSPKNPWTTSWMPTWLKTSAISSSVMCEV